MNRRERREYERMTGFRKEYLGMSPEEQAEIRKRKREAGKKIHRQHTETVHNNLNKMIEEREKKILRRLMDDGMSETEAIEFLNANKQIEENYSESLYQRKKKQSDKLI